MLAGDSEELRNDLNSLGIFALILKLLTRPTMKPVLLEVVMWTVSNMFKGKVASGSEDQVAFLRAFDVLLAEPATEEKTLLDILTALYHITLETHHGDLLKQISPETLVHLAMNTPQEVSLSALKVVGNLCYGSSRAAKALVKAKLVPVLADAIRLGNAQERVKEACWIVSNIVRSGKESVKFLIDGEVVQRLARVIKDESHFVVRKEATEALIGICETADVSPMITVNAGALDALADMLVAEDVGLLMEILSCINGILLVGKEEDAGFAARFEKAGGVGRLEKLDFHENQEVGCLAHRMLEDFFYSRPLIVENDMDGGKAGGTQREDGEAGSEDEDSSGSEMQE